MKICISFLFISILFFGLSCKKEFLDVIDRTQLLAQGYVVDLETTGQYMNGVYTQVSSSPGYADAVYMSYPALIADDIKPRRFFMDCYNWNQTKEEPTTCNGIAQWRVYYQVIRSCNFVIEKVDKYRSENPEKADNIKGQALTVRAWMHFLMVNMFAQSYNYTQDASHLGIPYVLTSDIEEDVSRQSVAQVYEKMINDLNTALLLLPKSFTDKQYINFEAAKALLARAYLFKEDFIKAKGTALEVLRDVPLMKENYPDKLYTKDETEALFQGVPSKDNDEYYSRFMGYYTTFSVQLLATNDIAQLYRQFPADKRNAWIRDSSLGVLITKFPIGVAGLSSRPETDYYQTFFRSTEMVLTAAECYAKLNIEDSARYFINQIRSRANIPIVASIVTGTALMDSIKQERRKEMAFDGLRMYDLQRWKLGVSRQDATSPNVKTLPYPSNKAIAPIPQADAMLKGLQQNPGY